MSDGWKTCFGFSFLILGLVLALLSVMAGGLGEWVESLGGNAWGIDLDWGVKVAAGVFIILFVAAIVFFASIREWTWLPGYWLNSNLGESEKWLRPALTLRPVSQAKRIRKFSSIRL